MQSLAWPKHAATPAQESQPVKGIKLAGHSHERDLNPQHPVYKTGALPVELPWHFLYFLPLPHGHGLLRPVWALGRRIG